MNCLAGLAAALVLVSAQTFSQTFPAKPIRIIAPVPPGGGSDLIARLVAQKVGDAGWSMVVENRPGADSIIGAELVAHALPDGYTLLLGNAAALVANLFFYRTLSYDPVKDFAPITGGGEATTLLVVGGAVPVNSVKELIAYARLNPGKLSYGTGSGVNGAYYMSGEAFKAVTGTDIVHVPYKGLSPAMTGLLSGEVDIAFTAASLAVSQARAGKLKVLAVLEGKRSSRLPEVPTVAETAPEFRAATIWNGFFAPAGVPVPVATRLNIEFNKALHSPDVVAKLDGLEVIGGTPDEFAAYVKGQVEVFGRIVKLLGIKPH